MQGSGASTGSWSNTGLPSMYNNTSQQQQRTTSNPRAYQSGDPTRDDMYAADTNQAYPTYPAGSYGGLGGYNQAYNPVYDTASPASGSRRTSGPGANVPGPKTTSTPPSATHQSPSTQYNYGARQTANSMYPSSAPAHMSSHQVQQQQPQTATASQYSYHDYYSQQGQQQQQQQQQQSQYGYYPPTYPTSSTGASRLPTQPQTAAAPAATASTDTHRNSGGSFDYSQQNQSVYPSQYAQHQWQQQGGRSSASGHAGAGQWQGYPMATPAVPHGYPSQPGHYPMQHWQQGGYYPPGTQPPHTAPPPTTTTKKSKKEPKDEYKGLGKRAPEPIAEEPVAPEPKKGKKAKKEEEKPIPKPPPKSHLHPPRQAQSAWQLFFTDELNKAKAAAVQGNSPGGTPHHAKLNVAQIAKDAGTAYANLDAEQKKFYATKVVESKEQYARELKIWQATLTPEDIRVENAFRAQQRKDGKSRKGNLKDPNAPKKPLSAYFLFLKGIRENDDLRAKVWADESETTKQSVLAAERWRSLSDEEKRPFLQQAEKDKQDYEAARKIYEDEAAARARGEDFDIKTDPKAEASRTVPPIPMAAVTNEHGQTVSIDSIVAPPTPTVDLQQQAPQVEATATTSPDFAQFTNVSDEDKKPVSTEDETDADVDPTSFDQSMDDFQGFHDPLEDMDLTGLGAMTADGEQASQQWDDLHNLMGEQTATTSVEPPKIEENADVDVAPSMAEAVSQSTELPSEPIAQTEPAIQQVAAEAEGEMSVPDAGPVLGNASGEPTEEVSELPQADVPPILEEPAPAAESTTAEPEPDFSASADLGNGAMDAEPAFDNAALGGDAAPVDDAVADSAVLDVPASPKADADANAEVGETVFPAPEPAPPAEDVTVAPATDNDAAAPSTEGP